jgi:hypothetical protein
MYFAAAVDDEWSRQMMDILPDIERHISNQSIAISMVAAQLFGMIHYHIKIKPPVATAIMDQLLHLWLGEKTESELTSVSLALFTQLGWNKEAWQPRLTIEEQNRVREIAQNNLEKDIYQGAAVMVAFHAGNIWSEKEMVAKLEKISWRFYSGMALQRDTIMREMGEAGKKGLANLKK